MPAGQRWARSTSSPCGNASSQDSVVSVPLHPAPLTCPAPREAFLSPLCSHFVGVFSALSPVPDLPGWHPPWVLATEAGSQLLLCVDRVCLDSLWSLQCVPAGLVAGNSTDPSFPRSSAQRAKGRSTVLQARRCGASPPRERSGNFLALPSSGGCRGPSAVASHCTVQGQQVPSLCVTLVPPSL